LLHTLNLKSVTSQDLGLHDLETDVHAVVQLGLSWEWRIANEVQCKYAFLFNDVTNLSTKEALRPIDTLYIARLCMYENVVCDYSRHHAAGPGAAAPPPSRTEVSVPRHTLASDEELLLILS